MYCEPTFIRMWENYVSFAGASLSQIFLAADQIWIIVVIEISGVDKARSRKLLAANHLISGKLQDIVVANYSWFKVTVAKSWYMFCGEKWEGELLYQSTAHAKCSY